MHMKLKVAWTAFAAIVLAGAYGSTLRATPGYLFSGSTVAAGRFEEIDVKANTNPADVWQARLKTQGQSDLYVQSNVWQPGGHTGWHTHPGPSLIMVTAGTVTAYEGDDPSCTPHVYPQGSTFVDPGGGHVHIIRNEGAVEARGVAVQLIAAGATRRIDAASPGNCPF
jgi:quercetin dioxygenase-like cupin family protein